MVQVGGFVAKRGASVLKRRKSRNRMERNSQMGQGSQQAEASQTPNTPNTVESQITKSESDGDVVFYMEEPRSGELDFCFSNCFS